MAKTLHLYCSQTQRRKKGVGKERSNEGKDDERKEETKEKKAFIWGL